MPCSWSHRQLGTTVWVLGTQALTRLEALLMLERPSSPVWILIFSPFNNPVGLSVL